MEMLIKTDGSNAEHGSVHKAETSALKEEGKIFRDDKSLLSAI